jgi:hypothetical protein
MSTTRSAASANLLRVSALIALALAGGCSSSEEGGLFLDVGRASTSPKEDGLLIGVPTRFRFEKSGGYGSDARVVDAFCDDGSCEVRPVVASGVVLLGERWVIPRLPSMRLTFDLENFYNDGRSGGLIARGTFEGAAASPQMALGALDVLHDANIRPTVLLVGAERPIRPTLNGGRQIPVGITLESTGPAVRLSPLVNNFEQEFVAAALERGRVRIVAKGPLGEIPVEPNEIETAEAGDVTDQWLLSREDSSRFGCRRDYRSCSVLVARGTGSGPFIVEVASAFALPSGAVGIGGLADVLVPGTSTLEPSISDAGNVARIRFEQPPRNAEVRTRLGGTQRVYPIVVACTKIEECMTIDPAYQCRQRETAVTTCGP